MRVSDQFKDTVVFIGRADSGPFVPYGTGFIVTSFIEGTAFQQLVTAKHVLDEIGSETVTVRINSHGGARLLQSVREHWLSHPDPSIDLAICPSALLPDAFAIRSFSSEKFLTDDIIENAMIGIGDDVIIAGLFVPRFGDVRNIPIIRSGIISAMPEEKIKTVYGYHYAYLVEARSIGGLSGSPVVVMINPLELRYDKEGKQRRVPDDTLNFYFIGMMLGHHNVRATEDDFSMLSGPLGHGKETEEEKSEAEETLARYVPLNTGIGVVLPASYIAEAINQPSLQRLRKPAMEKKQKKEGFVPDFAEGMEPPTTDENPQHREDFNRLLDAAVPGNKSDR